MKKKNYIIVLLLHFTSILSLAQDPPNLSPIDMAMEKAIVNDNWEMVFEKLSPFLNKSKDNCHVNAVARFIYGHSALIIGKNSFSTDQFYCKSDSTDSASLSEWLGYTRQLAAKYDKVSSVRYLLADAYARLGSFENAKSELDTSLSIDKNHVASLNARAVINWLLFENSEPRHEDYKIAALNDINSAMKLNPNFADLHANKAIFMMRSTGEMNLPRSELKKALAIDPTYWLAMNSYAFSFGVEGAMNKFSDIQDKIMENEPDTPFSSDFANNPSGLTSGARGVELSAGMKNGLPQFGIKLDLSKYNSGFLRGGIFTYLAEGENLVLHSDQKPIMIATWFNYNYPNKLIVRAKN